MQYKELEVKIKGAAGLLMHSGVLANPLNPIAKQMKQISSKRSKTDEDFALLSRLEWLGGLYTTEGIDLSVSKSDVIVSGGGSVCVPGEVLESALIGAAKKHKLGPQAKAGIMIDGYFPLEFPHNKKPVSDLFDLGYYDIRKVKVQQNSVMRTRPLFPQWSLGFTVQYLGDVISEDQILTALETCGRIVGLCEYRPKFGRFEVV